MQIDKENEKLFLEAVLKWNKIKTEKLRLQREKIDKDKEKINNNAENGDGNISLNAQESSPSPSSSFSSFSSSPSVILPEGGVASGKGGEDMMKGDFIEGSAQRESDENNDQREREKITGERITEERITEERMGTGEVGGKREVESEDEKKERGEEEGEEEGKEGAKEELKKKKKKERAPSAYLDLKEDFKRNVVRIVLRGGLLEEMMIDYEYSPSQSSPPPKKYTIKSKRNEGEKGEGMMEYSLNLVDVVRSIQSKFGRGGVVIKRKSIADIRRLIHREETDKIKSDQHPFIISQAKKLTEEEGIVFIDEIDKICQSSEGGSSQKHDASGEGVQRDLLPIIEGSDVSTSHGTINTKNILFIASGSFYAVRSFFFFPLSHFILFFFFI